MILISHPLTLDTPLYPGTPVLRIVPEKSIDDGNSSNSSIFTFSSHSTTHIDVPRHFCQDGKTVSDLLKRELSFSPAFCIDIPKGDDECLCPGDIQNERDCPLEIEALLIRTGYSRFRTNDPYRYINNHPWIHPDFPGVLRKKFPSLKIVCFDILSISTRSHSPEGRDAHRSFLCEKPPIFLIEDADLSSSCIRKEKLVLRIYPWIFENTDGVPVVAFLSEN